jgi:site-specific recombinase XerD
MASPISYQTIQYPTPQKHGSTAPLIAPQAAISAGQAHQPLPTLEQAKDAFIRALEGKNRTASTIKAYTADLAHFIDWLVHNNMVAMTPGEVQRADISDYLAYLSNQGLMGVSSARRLAAIREFFRFLESNDYISKNPAQWVETPKKEKNGRVYLRPDEYRSMLSLAGGNPRDFAILQVFLQTGIRVAELCNLRLSDVDFEGRTLKVAGKGMVEREIELERKGLEAIKNYLVIRLQTFEDHLFLNYQGQPLGERGVRKLVRKYKDKAGITKHASPHSLRHTFATAKAEKGVSPFQLQKWLGHANLNTTQIYVHIGRQNARKVMEATSL